MILKGIHILHILVVTDQTLITSTLLSDPTMAEKKDGGNLTTVPSQIGQVLEDQYYENDAVFGEITGEGPNYRSVCMA